MSGPTIPILGQPCTFLAFVPTVMITCNCDGQAPVLLVGMGGRAKCPACDRVFELNGIQFQKGQPQLAVNVGLVINEPSLLNQ